MKQAFDVTRFYPKKGREFFLPKIIEIIEQTNTGL